MAKLFPFRGEKPEIEQRPRLIGIDEEEADEVFAALSSDTARKILNRLYEEPGTASEAAEAADTSLQNARYHIDNLLDAGIIEPVDTWYSSRGTEMTVYAPTSEPLVLAAGQEEQTFTLRKALRQFIGALGVLAFASILFDRLLSRFGVTDHYSREDGRLVATEDPEPVKTVVEEATIHTAAVEEADTPTEVARTQAPSIDSSNVSTELHQTMTEQATTTASPTPIPGGSSGGSLIPIDFTGGVPPGILFFTGGLLILGIVAVWWYWHYYRPLVAG